MGELRSPWYMIAGAVAAVLMYHHVSAHAAGGPYGRALTVTPQEFASQLRLLRARGCEAVGVDKLVADVRVGLARSCEVALTFDDGYADAATEAAPLLRQFGDVGTFFVSTGYLGTDGHMTKAQVRALAIEGMEIGAHTVTHPDLTQLSGGAVDKEVRASRSALQAISGQTVDAFAYPAGRYNASVETTVRSAGFLVALSTDAGFVTPAALARDMFALPRFRVLRDQGESLVHQILGSGPNATPALSEAAVHSIARSRIAGNAPDVAERVAVALLSGGFPEQVLKVRVFKTAPAVVAGIMISGVKFHEPVDRRTFAADAADMVYRAFAADPKISQVDVWAVMPVAVASNATVSGDLAVPTSRTVFSASRRRSDWISEPGGLGTTYWEPGWLQGTGR
jgi:peptidoglycan/xylan/chitin deacetylase (PgdA/CDA1 family)